MSQPSMETLTDEQKGHLRTAIRLTKTMPHASRKEQQEYLMKALIELCGNDGAKAIQREVLIN